jgi:hypothetical protein
MNTLVYVHIEGLGLLALARKEENTHSGLRFGHKFWLVFDTMCE